MLDRREQRLLELAAFKEKARQILQTFEVKMLDEQPAAESMWLHKYHISVSVNNIGVAFPLSFQRDLGISKSRTIDSTAVRAFLFAIKSIAFGTNRGETGQATMKGFSFQFVSRYFYLHPSSSFCSPRNHVALTIPFHLISQERAIILAIGCSILR
jgi:hypothetical protein